jgi:AcrR family transcriptional regulator
MSRPSRGTDQRLIRAARELLPVSGCTGLNLREVARKAGVNLGMFHYHFGSKAEFVRRVLQELYEEFFRGFNLPEETTPDVEKRLRLTLLRMGFFTRDNRHLFVALLKDLLNGDEEVARFVRDNFARHVDILQSLVREGQSGGRFRKLEPLQSLMLLMAFVNGPNLVAGQLECRAGVAAQAQRIRDAVLSDRAVSDRVELALETLRSRSRGRGRKERR